MPARSTLARLARLPFLAGLLLLAALPARAFDLESARSDGFRVAEALALGSAGQWEAAEALVATAGPLVRDIVLWRKLRAGKGTLEEFQGFAARRAEWPGQDILRRTVLGTSQPYAGGSMSGAAAGNWSEFSRLWRSDRNAAESLLLSITGDPAALGSPGVWADRRLVLARNAVREGRAPAAYSLASQHFLTMADGYDYSDSEWVSGWVALRYLNDPPRAIEHFRRFRESVETPISLGRGGYWLGRAYEAAGNQGQARYWYQDAAQYQTSFYGQLAAAKVNIAGDPQLAASELPAWERHPAMASDDVRLAAILHFAGEDTLSMAVFNRLGQMLPAGALAPLTQLALDLGQPHYAVRIAKRGARRGVLIYPAYYPVHPVAQYVSKVEPALALSIARQETELNERAISHAGARGLMQLMPGTAQKVAGWIGEPYDRGRLTGDWRYNARLGETYLSRRVAQYGGSYVLAGAAYNAGAGRVDQWIAAMGDPRLPGVDMIDWMENIPFSETRNYVQRVMEGLYVYRTRLSGNAGPMTIEQDLARGTR